MRKITLLTLIWLSIFYSGYAQDRFHSEAKLSIDSSLTLINVGQRMYVYLYDANWKQIIEDESPEFSGEAHFGKYLTALHRGVKIYPDLAQKVIDIFKEVFTEEQMHKIANSYNIYGGKEYIRLGVCANPQGKTIMCDMLFLRDGPYAELPDSTYIKLYKLMMSRLKLNITDKGLKKYSYSFDVYMDDIINGTLTLKDYETD